MYQQFQQDLNNISQKDDHKSFEKLFLAYYPRLLSFAIHFLKSKEMAEEAVDDVFFQVWKNRKNLEHVKNISYYLFNSVKNKCLNYLRNSYINMYSLDSINTDLITENSDPEKICMFTEFKEELTEIIELLPQKCKIIFKMVKEDGLSYKEVAELLNISVKTVENQMGIALKKISIAIQRQNQTHHANLISSCIFLISLLLLL